ncbi:hypothetical protein [Thioalkalivibrio sp. HK1]|uniref:hypothetical protein n=1 Tax=Thioalkalivibrio sp. HK1 TaxID=1469245 RepID=UPI0004BC2CB2|nr:hypothetical protein [Thioalkalivibrio sp. HK1]
MRVVYILAAIIVISGWLSFELRKRNRALSQVFLVFCLLAAYMLIAAAFGLY